MSASSPLGELTVDAAGNGELRFTVPDMPAGDYTTLTHCVPCAPFSAGRELLPTGPDQPFVVLEGNTGSSGLPLLPVALGTAGGLGILAALLLGAHVEVKPEDTQRAMTSIGGQARAALPAFRLYPLK